MHIDERQKHLRRMRKRCAQAGQKERDQLLDETQAVTELYISESKDAKQIEAARRASAAATAHARTIRFVRRWAMRITLQTNCRVDWDELVAVFASVGLAPGDSA